MMHLTTQEPHHRHDFDRRFSFAQRFAAQDSRIHTRTDRLELGRTAPSVHNSAMREHAPEQSLSSICTRTNIASCHLSSPNETG